MARLRRVDIAATVSCSARRVVNIFVEGPGLSGLRARFVGCLFEGILFARFAEKGGSCWRSAARHSFVADKTGIRARCLIVVDEDTSSMDLLSDSNADNCSSAGSSDWTLDCSLQLNVISAASVNDSENVGRLDEIDNSWHTWLQRCC